MPSIFLTSKGIAKMILEGCPFEEIGVPGPFKATEARLKNPANDILDLMKEAKAAAAAKL
jgi:hypothetical protein